MIFMDTICLAQRASNRVFIATLRPRNFCFIANYQLEAYLRAFEAYFLKNFSLLHFLEL